MPHLLDVTMLWANNSGGVRSYLTAKQAWLRECEGWQHTIVAPGVRGAGAVSIKGWPVPFSGGYQAPLCRSGCATTLVRQSPDLIEVGDPYRLAWSSLDAARRLDVPVIGFCHSNLVAMARGMGGKGVACLARRYARKLYSNFDLVLAPSQNMHDELSAWGIERVRVQPLGVDTEVFDPSRRDPAWRASLGLMPPARVLVYAGRFSPEKHLQVLADAVCKLGDPFVLVAVGAGPVPPRGEQVIVLPFMNDKAALASVLASADALVHAGDQETFGLAALEAMACGCPVIARSAAALAELVDDTVGVRVEQGTADAFAQAIECFFKLDAAARDKMSQAARHKALAHRWPSVVAGLLQHYRRLLNHHLAESR